MPILTDPRSQAVLSLSITESFVHDVTQLLKLLRQGKVLKHGGVNESCFTVYENKAYYNEGLMANSEVSGFMLVVEPKKNLKLRVGDGYAERSQMLYRRSPGLWKHMLKYDFKEQVEHVLGSVKQKPFRTGKKKPINQCKQFTTLFLLPNLEILIRRGEDMKN